MTLCLSTYFVKSTHTHFVYVVTNSFTDVYHMEKTANYLKFKPANRQIKNFLRVCENLRLKFY